MVLEVGVCGELGGLKIAIEGSGLARGLIRLNGMTTMVLERPQLSRMEVCVERCCGSEMFDRRGCLKF